MRYSLIALAATTLLSSASARGHAHRRHAHAHAELAPRVETPTADECACSTYVTSYLVDYTPPAIPPTDVDPVDVDATTTVQAVKTIVPIVDATESFPPTGIPAEGVPTSAYSTPVTSVIIPDVSESGVPETDVPETDIPETDIPETDIPETDIPETEEPTPSEEVTTTVSSTLTSTFTSTAKVTVTSHSSALLATPSVSSVPESAPATSPAAPVPTPQVTTIDTPGTYTIPATTITLTSTEYVCAPETTSLAPGTQTYGGVTTIVETSTTVVCPLATVAVEDGVTTSKIYTTTYICPTPGTYVIGATTSTITGSATVPVEYPVPTAYPPGTYVQPEVVTTITVTSQVVTCPFFTADPTSEPTTTAAAVTTTEAAVVSTSTAPATTVDATTEVASAAPTTEVTSAAPSTTEAATTEVPSSSVVATVISSSSTSSSAPAQSSSAGIISTGSLWAITYSPYSNDQGCKTASEVEADIADIASRGFQNVRIYSTDCSGLENVGGSVEKHGLGLILGIFLKSGGTSTGDAQVSDILKWGKWELVVLVVVGNEAIFNGYCSAAELAGYMVSVSSQFKGAGYTGPVTTTETLNILQANGATLCSAMDVIGVNIHPFFNAGTTADQAGTFMTSQIALTEAVCSGKKAWVLEAGWPSSGDANGLAVPGVEQQKTAIAAIASAAPGVVAYFTYTDDYWKPAGAYNVEQHFGCAQLFAS